MLSRDIKSVVRVAGFFVLFVSLAGVLLLLPALVSKTFTYYRWDNVEYFIPMIKWAHGLILDGHLPVMNLRQHLGEPFATNIQTGVFYPIYTIAVAIFRISGLADQHLALIVIWLNLGLAISGFFCLARQYGLNTPLSLALAILTQTNGYVLAYSGVWLFVSSITAWLPWCLVGLTALWQGKQWGGLLFAVSYGLIGNVGHPQFWAYTSLFLMLLILLHGRKNSSRIFSVLPYFFCGLIIAAPTLLPVLEFQSETSRVGKVALETFLDVSATKSAFLGILSPLLNVTNGFLSAQKVSPFNYQGPLSAICIVFGLYHLRKMNTGSFFMAVLMVTAVFMLFAMGDHFPVYKWTYGIPVWSSFRWPSKFVLFVQFGFALLALCGLSRLVQQKSFNDLKVLYIITCAIFLFWTVTLIVPQYRSPLTHLTSAHIIIIAAFASFLCLLWIHRHPVHWVILALAILSSIATNALIHDLNLKNYPEAYEVDYAFEDHYRVSPTGKDAKEPYRLSRFNLAQSATALKYYSLTGVTHDIVSTRYREAIPSGIFGGLPGEWLSEKLETRFFEFLGVRFFVVSDDYVRNLFARTPNNYALSRKKEAVDLYKNPQAMPFAFFATQTTGQIDWTTDPTVVHSDGLRLGKWSSGKVIKTELTEGGHIRLRVSCPGESLLVVSFLYLPGWKVSVDEAEEIAPRMVNDLVMGLRLPEGIHTLEFTYYPPFLKPGLFMAGIGFFAMIWIFFFRGSKQFKKRRYIAHDPQ
ncbi:MAG: YfhO family protein [Desulfobacterales bacterium]